MRTLIIDGDVFVYEAAQAHEFPIQWDEDLWTLHAHFQPAAEMLRDRLATLQKKLHATHVVVAVSDYTDPWRKRVLPTYKANRQGKRKPLTFTPLREMLHEEYKTYQKPGLEADDVCGILLTHPTLLRGEKVLVSLDKDMRTLPGEHYNNQKNESFSITADEADYNHLKQTLTGDTTDGYKGCPGYGDVSAKKLLDATEPSERWGAVVGAFEKKGLSETVALQNARVARICRYTDYDYVKKEVKLWNPAKA